MINFKTIFERIMSIGTVQRQSIVSFIWVIALTLIGFLSTMYFAHAEGARILGAYFLFTTYYSIIVMVIDGGLGGAAVKRISEGEEQNEYLSAFFMVSIFLTIAAVIILILFRSYFVDLNNSGLFYWLLLIVILNLFAGPVSVGVMGRGKMGIFSTSSFISQVSRILIQVVAVFFGFSVAGLAGGFAASILIPTIIQWRFFDLHFMRFGWRHIKRLSTFSFWLFLTSSGSMLYSYSDTVMISYYLSNVDVGVYRVMFQFSSVALFISTSLINVLWVNVSKWGKINDISLIEESLSRAFSFSFLLAIPVLAGGILLGNKLLYFFYGGEFAKGYSTLIVLLFVQIVSIFQGFFLNYLSALDRQKYAFRVTALSGSANIVLNIILIPMIGIIGAAIATLVTVMLNAVLAHRELSKIITIRMDQTIIMNILKASAAMSVFLMVYRLFVPLSNIWLTLIPVMLGGAIYGILILKFDSKIYNELKEVVEKMNLTWPRWL